MAGTLATVSRLLSSGTGKRQASSRGKKRSACAAENEGSGESTDDINRELREIAKRRHWVEELARELSKEDESEVDLPYAALCVAAHDNPDLDVEDHRAELDRMAEQVVNQLPPPMERYPLRMLKSISQVMFNELGFHGANGEYYTPEVSFLHHVLSRRKGIPITLGLVYMEIAARIGLAMVPVLLPMHMMLRPIRQEMEMLVDPYTGEIKFVEEVEDMLAELMGGGETRVEIDRSFLEDESRHPRSFMTRLISNVKEVYFQNRHFQDAKAMSDYLEVAAPSENVRVYNMRDRGICLYCLERYPEAVEDLTNYLESIGEANDRQHVEAMIDMARKNMGR